MGKFLFWTFRRWEIRSSLDSKSWCNMIFSSAWNTMFFEYGKVLLLNFSEIGNTVFFYLKSWWKVDIFLVFLNFSWYSQTWEIWFFVQWKSSWRVICWSIDPYKILSAKGYFSFSQTHLSKSRRSFDDSKRLERHIPWSSLARSILQSRK